MHSPTRFAGQWANGRRLDPTKTRPFKDTDQAWSFLIEFLVDEVGDPGYWSGAAAPYTGPWRTMTTSCVQSREGRPFIYVPKPSSWSKFAWFMLAAGFIEARAMRLVGGEGWLPAMGEAIASMETKLLPDLCARLGDPSPHRNGEMLAAIPRHLQFAVEWQLRYAVLPDTAWPYWDLVEPSADLRKLIPTRSDDAGESALAELL